ncbi:MAG: TetR family transcriptional regulator [Desulfobacteraceae bacterium]|nr:TetR family transcriptional regulator [Desulfobacteraceae bacterium]
MINAPDKLSTKERIIQVAERLFADKGLDGTSMRDIADAAGVNLASANYHFGSKDGLIAAVFQRQILPMNAERLKLLDTLEAASPDTPLELERVLEAFIRPAVIQAAESRRDNKPFLRLMGRCLSEPSAYSEKYVYPHFTALIKRFYTAVGSSVPGLSQEEVFWLVGFVAGALHFALHMWSTENLPHKPARPLGAEELVARLTAFAAAGLRSGVAGKTL